MEDMENKLGAILGNPEMMQKIMSLAKSFEEPSKEDPPVPTPVSGLPDLDMGTIQKLTGLIGRSSIDQNQRSLLRALAPYISNARIRKLERAMQAARMASVATTLFGNGQFPFGR